MTHTPGPGTMTEPPTDVIMLGAILARYALKGFHESTAWPIDAVDRFDSAGTSAPAAVPACAAQRFAIHTPALFIDAVDSAPLNAWRRH